MGLKKEGIKRNGLLPVDNDVKNRKKAVWWVFIALHNIKSLLRGWDFMETEGVKVATIIVKFLYPLQWDYGG